MPDAHSALRPGDEFEVTTGPIAHGGHVVAHHDGHTVFVRHALPGERVRVRVESLNRKIVRAEAVEVLEASPDRVEPPCRWAGPHRCGGCDFQHVSLGRQRQLKQEVLENCLQRLGGMARDELGRLDTRVHELPGHPDGLGWMTRVRWAQGPDGAVGLRAWRSHDVIPVDRCLLAVDRVREPGRGPVDQTRQVLHRTWEVTGFWQVHEGLPSALVDSVLEFGSPQPDELWWDLYAGAGLFAAFLGEAVGDLGHVDAVEADPAGVRSAVAALADLPQVTIHAADVRSWIDGGDRTAPDGVVLDPPRDGVGAPLMSELADAGIPRLVYVACDPAALARDVAVARDRGYRVARVRAFDAFPMTHHFETVVLLVNAQNPSEEADPHALS